MMIMMMTMMVDERMRICFVFSLLCQWQRPHNFKYTVAAAFFHSFFFSIYFFLLLTLRFISFFFSNFYSLHLVFPSNSFSPENEKQQQLTNNKFLQLQNVFVCVGFQSKKNNFFLSFHFEYLHFKLSKFFVFVFVFLLLKCMMYL